MSAYHTSINIYYNTDLVVAIVNPKHVLGDLNNKAEISRK